MKIAIFSDVHGNWPAFKTCLRDAKKKGAEVYVSLGDVVGYNCRPNKCLDIVRKKFDISLIGNHELLVAEYVRKLGDTGDYVISRKTDASLVAAQWTARKLTQKNQHYLLDLVDSKKYSATHDDLGLADDSMHFSHSTPLFPEDMNYISGMIDAHRACVFNTHVKTKLNFVGHAHLGGVYGAKNSFSEFIEDDGRVSSVIDLTSVDKLLGLTGSVGQPRTGCTDTSYFFLDTSENLLELRKLPYDVKKFVEKMKQISDFKEHGGLYRRLLIGR